MIGILEFVKRYFEDEGLKLRPWQKKELLRMADRTLRARAAPLKAANEPVFKGRRR